MTLPQIARLGKELAKFLMLFAGCFRSRSGFALFQVYIKGLLSNVQRKNIEAMALEFGTAPRTLQRFVESIKWAETRVRDQCQQIVVQEHPHPRAIGCVDESGTAKSGTHTGAAARQWLGSRGKVDNGVVGVHLSYSAPGFQCLLDSEAYLPKEWADDRERRRKHYIPESVEFRTKPQIALVLMDRALGHGIQVAAWTFDAVYGRDGAFLDGLETRRQVFVGEIPANFHGWLQKPRVLRSGPSGGRGRKKKYPRPARRPPACEVQNLVHYSPLFTKQRWQRYRIKDTERGPEVWEVKWAVFWRKGPTGLPERRHTLIVARNVLTGEVKYFLANRVPGERGITLRWLLSVAFQRWSIESCFRQAKEELGLDHYEVRGWRCLHRHFYLTQLSHLFCARIRQKFAAETLPEDRLEELTTEQVRRAMNTWLTTFDQDLAPLQRLKREQEKQRYYQRRNRQARLSHTKTRRKRLASLGIDPDRIKSCVPVAAA
jgi:SRSO17 transposase